MTKTTCIYSLTLKETLQTRPKDCSIDGVGIMAVLNKPPGPEILLQKQYRPPIDKVVIEVPAGLIDAGETVEECAVRELKEETGYVGVAEETSPVMFNGMCSSFRRCVFSSGSAPWTDNDTQGTDGG